MFDLHIEKGVLSITSGDVEWVRVDGNWYHGNYKSDDRTAAQLDEQLASFVEAMR